jgi:hypothetical protein
VRDWCHLPRAARWTRALHRYSVYLLYWYKSTNTDAAGALTLRIGLLNGGAAEQSGVLQPGDILQKIDGITVYGKTHSEVLTLLLSLLLSLHSLHSTFVLEHLVNCVGGGGAQFTTQFTTQFTPQLTGCTSTAVKVLTPEELQVLMLIEGAADTMVELDLLRDQTILTVEIRRESTSNPKKARAGPLPSGEFDPSLYADVR